MASAPDAPQPDAETLLAATSDRFRALHAALGELVLELFPDAEPTVDWNMAGWRVPVPDPPAEEEWKGTMPRTYFAFFPSEKKAGLTFHVWHPKDPYILKENADWLKGAGFKPMVGCLQWNRKADVPLDVFRRLLGVARDAL